MIAISCYLLFTATNAMQNAPASKDSGIIHSKCNAFILPLSFLHTNSNRPHSLWGLRDHQGGIFHWCNLQSRPPCAANACNPYTAPLPHGLFRLGIVYILFLWQSSAYTPNNERTVCKLSFQPSSFPPSIFAPHLWQ
jgi:hypothetical protein